uniref:Uncharacterized protein n=1 Tax=Kalanchoe fedtschenkoi TaxID=63787 RepID=A0A7N0SZN5_KALFE
MLTSIHHTTIITPVTAAFSNSLIPTPPLPAQFLRFRTSPRENFRYLKTLGIIEPNTKFYKSPSPETLDKILSTVEFFTSRGFSTSDFRRVAFLCPELFSPDFDPSCVQPVFDFLATELPASPEQCKGLIVRCPGLLLSDVDLCLRQTWLYLKSLGVEKLNAPTTLNAHLLNTRVPKLAEKVRYLRSVGLSYEEAGTVCARFPAIFGYSVEHNLRPKVEFLKVMGMSAVEVLNGFPQYLGFSLQKRIAPRYLHLQKRKVKVPLKRMLMWGDEKFYGKWK